MQKRSGVTRATCNDQLVNHRVNLERLFLLNDFFYTLKKDSLKLISFKTQLELDFES